MRAHARILFLIVMVLPALAGCSAGPKAESELAFTATALDADRTRFRFDAVYGDAKDVAFKWDFGDRTPNVAGKSVEHTYEHPGGEYSVRLTATSPQAADQEWVAKLSTGDGTNAAPLLYLRVDKRLAAVDEEILFDAFASQDPDGDPLFFEWDFNSPMEASAMGSMENLGNQAYGRYPSDKPPPAEPPAAGGEPGPSPDSVAWRREVDAARDRLERRAGIERLDGDHSTPEEKRNPDVDGRISDEGPVQAFAYPGTAVYYVHVSVVDIKGASDEGFIRIKVEEAVPPGTNTTSDQGELRPAPIGATVGTVEPKMSERAAYPFKYEHPGVSALTLTYTETPIAEKKVGVWVCGAGAYPDCKTTSKASLAEGESGRVLTWDVGPGEDFPYTYTVYIGNMGNSLVEYEVRVETTFDLNPWAKEEAGFAVGH